MLVQFDMARRLVFGLLKINRIILYTFVCIVLSNNSFGQDNERLIYLQKQKKVDAEMIGASYRVEIPIKNKFTHIFHAGLQYSFVITSGNVIEKYYSSLDAVVASGVRYYYNITNKNGQNTGKFFEIDVGVKSGSIISKNMYYPAYIFLRPHWGVQFAAGKRTSIELGAGITVGSSVIEKYKGIAVAPNLQFRVSHLLKRKSKNKYDF